ncbi:type 4a pilus biogenesis protein PilO [Patescibacteria group bacterium]|nr:type 4a pilus biogenesis protein PilO [Patescibacteria group bacterium]MBU1519089.1 type 4a pilus biogenesis protein PilO [Patescibacteria group bacterium]MBU1729949.1 type 4a pilus biogenesis protein PilO [Patescibacteria group bacterium]MBU2416899.1 type 4a pilus biogenesis protein PilO [Patescibacteria group bacterium]MBU2461056.1 type 4a pilus biogenesis protein PilO [Patescibacteria group bacterium]
MFRLLLPFILIFFIGSLCFSYIKPGFSQIEDLKQEIKEVRVTLDEKKEEIESALKNLEEIWGKVSLTTKNKLHRLVPTYADFDEAVFINHINNIAKGHGMNINNIQFSNQPMDSVKGDYGEFTMSFTVESEYREFRAFLNDLERNEQMLDINDLSFQAKSQDDYGLNSYKLSLVTYWLK